MLADAHMFALERPYDAFRPLDTATAFEPVTPGAALVWFVTRHTIQAGDLDWVARRPRGVSCALVLPSPSEIPSIAPFLNKLTQADPNVVLPSGRLATPNGVKAALMGG